MTQHEIGTDKWVEQYEQRVRHQSGLRALVDRIGARLPLWARFGLLIGLGLLLPLLTDNPYVIRIAGNIALIGTLAVGLNVVVGYAGLLDLGYVAFYGIGGYAYAYLSSDFSGLHWPTWITIPVVVLVTALFGLLLGLPSLRLVGDYLAIVTLGFGQIFVNLATAMTRVYVPWQEDPINLTGGPNGIVNLDKLSLFGFTARAVTDYYVILLFVLALVLLAVYFINNSRIGRAWRAIREDELAAEVMGMPSRRLKLLAFAIGAAIAGLSGSLFAAWQGAVFPINFDVMPLITLYAIVVLGGLGSLPGVVIGAILMTLVPEILRDVELAGLIFYAGTVIILYFLIRPRWHIIPLLLAVAAFGIALRALVPGTEPLIPTLGPSFSASVRSWLVLPDNPITATDVGNVLFLVTALLVLVVSRIRQYLWRLVALVPTLYLLAYVWETRLSQEPSITRLLFVGLLLVVLMIYRPQGLLGRPRVEVV